MRLCRVVCILAIVLLSSTALFAQQTGSLSGKVMASDGTPLPGVTVEAKSNVLPQPRVTTTLSNGEYTLPQLPPGNYTLTFSLSGMQTQTRNVTVYLGQTTPVNAVTLGVEALQQSITVTAETPLVNPNSTEISTSVNRDAIIALPTGQNYQDLLKLAPGVQDNQAATVRGPASGGSEQDNVYQFDGVNVTLPLFGTLAAEPSTQDIAQVTFTKGGAKAIDFNRSAGFTVDTVSKSGTSSFTGELKYQFQNGSLVAKRNGASGKTFDQKLTWGTLSLGGPIVRDRLFFYGSYYRPTVKQSNSANLYGSVPDVKNTRDEGFGKLTYTPTANILLNGSFRDSRHTIDNSSLGAAEAPSVALSDKSTQRIAILEGSWVVNSRSYLTGKFNDYGLKTSSLPKTLLSATPSASLGTTLDLNNLEQFGYFIVPSITAKTSPAFNAFAQPFIDRYGYVQDGVKTGGGAVGGASQINEQNFYRKSGQAGYNVTLGSMVTHDVHVGYQWFLDEEDLSRASNGWGVISPIGGTANCPTGTQCAGQPYFFEADFQRSNVGTAPRQNIKSQYESQNIEINDTIKWQNWSFNLGVLASDDTLYGQGLREDPTAVSGYVAAPGHKYKEYNIPFMKQVQPRLGATWAYNGTDTVYASFARYNPAANSLPRAASWDRNTLGLVTQAFFDQNGVLIGSRQLRASSGKLFQENMSPRHTDEWMIGTGQQFTSRWSGRLYARYRSSKGFWEDTPNDARVDPRYAAPPDIPHELYIPNLEQARKQIGSGSSYVIAALDGAFTKYYEATVESEARVTDKLTLNGTYTWSHYYGNFDQDDTSTTYDFATFIGSSNIADGVGRQVWDNHYGNLHADRRHLLKVYGYYSLPWNATFGAWALYQSGHHWEAWSWRPYASRTTSRASFNRYAEPAGSRVAPSHTQVDLNYTQNIPVPRMNMQLIADVYNLFDQQTGYAPYPDLENSRFGSPRVQYAPRRINLAVRLMF